MSKTQQVKESEGKPKKGRPFGTSKAEMEKRRIEGEATPTKKKRQPTASKSTTVPTGKITLLDEIEEDNVVPQPKKKKSNGSKKFEEDVIEIDINTPIQLSPKPSAFKGFSVRIPIVAFTGLETQDIILLEQLEQEGRIVCSKSRYDHFDVLYAPTSKRTDKWLSALAIHADLVVDRNLLKYVEGKKLPGNEVAEEFYNKQGEWFAGGALDILDDYTFVITNETPEFVLILLHQVCRKSTASVERFYNSTGWTRADTWICLFDVRTFSWFGVQGTHDTTELFNKCPIGVLDKLQERDKIVYVKNEKEFTKSIWFMHTRLDIGGANVNLNPIVVYSHKIRHQREYHHAIEEDEELNSEGSELSGLGPRSPCVIDGGNESNSTTTANGCDNNEESPTTNAASVIGATISSPVQHHQHNHNDGDHHLTTTTEHLTTNVGLQYDATIIVPTHPIAVVPNIQPSPRKLGATNNVTVACETLTFLRDYVESIIDQPHSHSSLLFENKCLICEKLIDNTIVHLICNVYSDKTVCKCCIDRIKLTGRTNALCTAKKTPKKKKKKKTNPVGDTTPPIDDCQMDLVDTLLDLRSFGIATKDQHTTSL